MGNNELFSLHKLNFSEFINKKMKFLTILAAIIATASAGDCQPVSADLSIYSQNWLYSDMPE